MPDKKIIIRRGERLTIEVNRRRRPEAAQATESRGLIRARRADDYSPRRIKAGGFIEIYDLGYILSGASYETHSWYRHQAQSTLSNGQVTFENDFILDYHKEKDAAVLATIDDAFKISPEANEALYSLGFYIEDEFFPLEDLGFNASGVELSPAQLSANYLALYSPSNDLFYSVNFNGDTPNLVTAEFDPESEPVSFNLSAGDKIYLSPAVHASRGLSQTSGNMPPHEDFDKYLNFTWHIFPREIYLDEENPFYGFSTHAAWTIFGAGNWELTSQAIQVHKAFSFARAFKVEGSVPPFVTTSIPVADFPDALFPLYPSTPTATTDFTPLEVQMTHNVESETDGILVAVIKRGGQTFYIWSNEV